MPSYQWIYLSKGMKFGFSFLYLFYFVSHGFIQAPASITSSTTSSSSIFLQMLYVKEC